MNRRTFLAALGAAATLPAFSAEDSAKKAPTPTQAAFVQPPTAQIVGGDALAICWRTATPSAGTVRWTQDPDLPRDRWPRARRVVDGLVASNRPDHLVTLRGVDFAKPLRFEVESVATTMDPWWTRFGERSAGGIVTVPALIRPDGALTFAVLNDLHANTALIPKLLAIPAVAAAKPAFVALNGDCAGNVPGPEGLRKALLGPMADLTAQGIPLLFARGNHEYRGVMARRLREAFAPYADTDAYHAAFDLGPLSLLILDSGEDKVDSHREYCDLLECEALIAQEGAWAQALVRSPAWRTGKKRLALCHIPPTNGDPRSDAKHGPTRLRQHLAPALAEGKIDLLLAAHDHRASHLPPAPGRPYPTLIGGGPKESSATVTLIAATPTTLTATTYALDGSNPLPTLSL